MRFGRRMPRSLNLACSGCDLETPTTDSTLPPLRSPPRPLRSALNAEAAKVIAKGAEYGVESSTSKMHLEEGDLHDFEEMGAVFGPVTYEIVLAAFAQLGSRSFSILRTASRNTFR